MLLDCDLAYGLWRAKYPGQKHVCSKNDTDTKEDMDMHGRAPCPGPNNSPGAIGARHAPHAARPARTPDAAEHGARPLGICDSARSAGTKRKTSPVLRRGTSASARGPALLVVVGTRAGRGTHHPFCTWLAALAR